MATDLTNYSGQVVSLSLVGINTTATVSGSLPITGAQQTLNNTLVIGSVSVNISSFDPSGSQSKNIGDTGIKFTGIRFTAGSAEDLKLYSIRWRMNGSASASDLANLVTVVNGTSYPAVASPDGRYVTSTFPGGILLQKGFSLDAYIQGDIVGSNASGRVAEFDIDKQADVYFVGQLYGYGVQIPYNSTGTVSTASTHGTTYASSGNPIFQGSTFSITGAAATSVAKATEVPAQNVSVNVPNQPVGGYIVDLRGEPVSVQSQVFTVSTSTSSGAVPLTNVTIVDDTGAVVAGPVDMSNGSTALTFTDTVTYKTGRHVYTLKGKYASGFSNGATVSVSFTPSTAWTNSTGQVTGNSFTWPATAVTMNTMTIRAASLAVTVSSNPPAQNIVAGGQGITFANLQFDASQSGEDVRFSSLGLTASTSAALSSSGILTSCQLWDGTTALNTGSNVVNPTITATAFTASTATFTLDNSITVAKGTVKTLTLKCNVASGATGSLAWGITSTQIGAISASGVTSSVTVTPSGATNNGQLMTIASGSLVASLDSSAPSYTVVAAGSTGVTVNAIKLRPSNEPVWLNKLGLKLTNTASSSAADFANNPYSVTLWIGGVQVGTATFTGANTNATSSISCTASSDTSVTTGHCSAAGNAYLLPKNVDTVVTVKADLAAQGQTDAGGPGVPGHLLAVDVDTNGTNTDITGANSGTTISPSGSTSSSGVRIFKSYPIFTYSTTGATANNGNNDLLVLTVTAPSSGPVKLNKLTFKVSTTTASLSNVTFAGPSGNVASTTNVILTSTASNPSKVIVWFDSTTNTTDAEIGMGTSKTYTLRGDLSLTGTNTTGAISTSLAADTAYPSLSGFMASALSSSLTGQNLVWSPMTTTSPATATNDWTNGYGLGGCFATSGIGNDCTSRTIAK